MNNRIIMPVIENGAAATAEIFAGMDVDVLLLAVNRIVPLWDEEMAVRIRLQVRAADWLFLTSANGVEQFCQIIDCRSIRNQIRLAVVGPNTADAVADYGFTADFMPSDYRGAALAGEFISSQQDTDQQLLVVRPLRMGSPLVNDLQEAGFSVDELILYTTEAIPEPESRNISFSERDIFVFRSPSGVSAFLENYTMPENAIAVAIGPSTEKRIRQAGHANIKIAENSSREHLLAAVQEVLRTQ